MIYLLYQKTRCWMWKSKGWLWMASWSGGLWDEDYNGNICGLPVDRNIASILWSLHHPLYLSNNICVILLRRWPLHPIFGCFICLLQLGHLFPLQLTLSDSFHSPSSLIFSSSRLAVSSLNSALTLLSITATFISTCTFRPIGEDVRSQSRLKRWRILLSGCSHEQL